MIGLTRDSDRFSQRRDFFESIAENLAPPASAPLESSGGVLRLWRDRSGLDLLLLGPDGRPVADSGGLGYRDMDHHGRGHGGPPWRRGRWVDSIDLPDGRRLVALRPAGERWEWRRLGWLFALAGMGLAVGIAAYPLVRRLTRRLETLQQAWLRWGRATCRPA